MDSFTQSAPRALRCRVDQYLQETATASEQPHLKGTQPRRDRMITVPVEPDQRGCRPSQGQVFNDIP